MGSNPTSTVFSNVFAWFTDKISNIVFAVSRVKYSRTHRALIATLQVALRAGFQNGSLTASDRGTTSVFDFATSFEGVSPFFV